MHLIGLHIDSSLDNIFDSVIEAKNNGANIVQFFVSPNIKDKSIYHRVNNFLIKHNMKCVIHASYTINLAQNWDTYSWWIQQFIEEIRLANVLNALYIVIHLGKYKDLSKEEAINNMYSSLLYIHQESKKFGETKILIETSTGQGTELGYKLEELTTIYRKFSKHKKTEIVDRFGICLDTCHIFSAGYNIKNKESREIFFDNFNELIGMDQIKLIHMNDSKVECGAHVDRHQNIGDGYIGKEPLLIITEAFKKLNIPIILETPYKNVMRDLKIIK